MSPIGIVGAGAWGTALGIRLAASGNRVALWGRDAAVLGSDRQNARYLPGIIFPDGLAVVQHLEALRGCEIVLLAVPAQSVRDTAALLRAHLEPASRIVLCAKGIELASGKLLSKVVAEELPASAVAVLSGPSFAAEVAMGMPTAATIAAHRSQSAEELADALSSATLRLYHSTDVAGVELAGALKNVVAIACGIVIGAGLGENARAALMTRGLAEIARLGIRLGARSETLMGLAGLGDLALTCGSLQSRNFSYGHCIGGGDAFSPLPHGRGREAYGAAVSRTGEGVPPHESLPQPTPSSADPSGPAPSPMREKDFVLVEGIATAEAVLTLAARNGVEMPIASTVHAILSGTLSIEDAIPALMMRPLKEEGS